MAKIEMVRPLVLYVGVVKNAECHTDKPHYANGLCRACYNALWQSRHKSEPRKHKPKCDLTGKKFGMLTVLRQAEHLRPGRRPYVAWLCRCDCGKERPIRADHLSSGYVQSCGCLRGKKVANEKGCGLIPGSLWSTLRWQAKRRRIPFEVTIEQGWALFLAQGGRCALSGVELKLPAKWNDDRTASLDRIESTGDYTFENVQWVHSKVNLMKGTLSDAEFILWCQKVTETRAP